jgi:hypothetical protein
MRLYIIILLIMPSIHALPSAVTYDFSGGRLGDNLLSYCHAKWISYLYNIPLLYRPFAYSDQFVFHDLEIPYSDELGKQFERVIQYDKNTIVDPEASYLYVIPFFPESIFNREDVEFPYLFTVDWHNPQFKAILQTCIFPLYSFQSPTLNHEYLNVAVHVRKGTGWDIPNYRITPKQLTASHPLRFAPDSFYCAELKNIAACFPEKKIYVYLFTDHNKPDELAHAYAKQVDCDRMIFDYRHADNNEFINVLDDFFALTHFDCLIRPDSNFSFIASKLGNYQLVISPWHGTVTGEDTTIDEICYEENGHTLIYKELCL